MSHSVIFAHSRPERIRNRLLSMHGLAGPRSVRLSMAWRMPVASLFGLLCHFLNLLELRNRRRLIDHGWQL